MNEVEKLTEDIRLKLDKLDYIAEQLTLDDETIHIWTDALNGDLLITLHFNVKAVEPVTINLTNHILEDYKDYGKSSDDEDRHIEYHCISKLAEAFDHLSRILRP